MTPEDHTKAWRNNLKAKAQEIQQILKDVIGLVPQAVDEKRRLKLEERLQTVTAKCNAMHGLFGPNLAPGSLQELTQHQAQAR